MRLFIILLRKKLKHEFSNHFNTKDYVLDIGIGI